MVFDVWAHPDHRGGKLHWAGASMAAQEARRLGRTGIYAGVEEHEFYLFAAKYAGFGLGLIVPHSSIFGIKVFGLKMRFDGTPPPRASRIQPETAGPGIRQFTLRTTSRTATKPAAADQSA